VIELSLMAPVTFIFQTWHTSHNRIV